MIEQPPKLDTKLIQKATKLSARTDVTPLIRNINDDYLYWTEVKYKSHPADLSSEHIGQLLNLTVSCNR